MHHEHDKKWVIKNGLYVDNFSMWVIKYVCIGETHYWQVAVVSWQWGPAHRLLLGTLLYPINSWNTMMMLPTIVFVFEKHS